MCFVCASKCAHSFVNCNECGLTFHSECLQNKDHLAKFNSRFELPCKIAAEAVEHEIEQCQVCEQLEQLLVWKDKAFVKELIKTLEGWYENAKDENGASENDRRILTSQKCDINDVLSSKEIKEEFQRGASRSSKIMPALGTKEFPVFEISELRKMINENRISLRDFLFHLWCWITAIRSLGEKRKASLIYAHLCNEQIVSYVKEHLKTYLSCPTHYMSMNEEYLRWKEEHVEQSAKKDRFPICEPPHQFAWHKNKLVFILKSYQEIDGLKIEYQEVYRDTFESRGQIPVEKFQRPTHDQILNAKPQKNRKRKRNTKPNPDQQYIEAYKEFLKKLGIEDESVEIDEELLFDPEKHQQNSKNVHTQTCTSVDWQTDTAVENNEVEEGALEEIQDRTKMVLENIERENKKPRIPKCSVCLIEFNVINKKKLYNSKEVKLAKDAVYFSTDFQMFSCEGCYAIFDQVFDELFVKENTGEGLMQFKNGASIAKTFVKISELQKVYNP